MPTDIVGQITADPGPFATGTVYPLSQLIRPSTPNGLYYKQTVHAGASASAEPAWPLIVGNTVVDNGGNTWTCWADLPMVGVAPAITVPVNGDTGVPQSIIQALGELTDWAALLSSKSYAQEDLFAARDLIASGRNIPAGVLPALPLGGVGSYQANFGPQPGIGNATYVSAVALDVDAGESAGQLSVTLTGTSIPVGSTKLATVGNTGGLGSNRVPEAIVLFPLNSEAAIFPFGQANIGVFAAAASPGWVLWIQNATGGAWAVGAITLQWSYIAIF